METTRTPRTIALANNASELFDKTAENYDAVAGTPPGLMKQGTAPDYAAHPVNPPTPPAPARNLKGY